jgi:hypothetical protein
LGRKSGTAETEWSPSAARLRRSPQGEDATNQLTLSIDLVQAARRSETLRHLTAADSARQIRAHERFLLLTQRHGGPVAPTREIDEIWHLHMLHPVAYHADCTRLFGRILDHDGGFGTEPEERPVLGKVFARTAALWQAEFGEPYVATLGAAPTDVELQNCLHDCSNRCWHACSSKIDMNALVEACA